MVNPLKHVYLEVAVNGCCIAPVNVIKFKINYLRFFRDMEKTEYVLNVCQFRWRKSNHFVKLQLKSKNFANFLCMWDL